ncbi:ketopantoate reductase family protein [Weissella thailandensis]|uniref:2-dehydropantoate 2-reductase n=1 Tax=Weissella thailandensis TaxID=89061 RepID=A0ABX9I3V5_9LACO|nr:ketopantoate reductase family protein [Weissella thailandensis]NKY91107.1 ketopantoate reductase family protein [Weissella thailandensis]RDS59390.1 ketopantoate reductase family protein [Weissella thailandensis]GEP74500.1 2-dehydropantoate 2-reductase [Weissella thailandensis]
MKYAVLGSGAMGLRFGVLLQEAGFEVDFVDTWEQQVETIRSQRGVYVSRDGQNKHLVPVNVYYPEEYHGQADVLIVFTKQYMLADLLERRAHFFNDKQYTLTCMNGMGHIEKLNQYFPSNRVIGGTAMIGTVLNQAGDVDFIGQKGAGSVNLANQTEQPDEMTHQLIGDFKTAGLNPTLTDNFTGTLMAKVVFNSVVNTLCTMFRVRMGEFIQAPTTRALSVQLIDEAYDVCERAGIKLLTSRQEEWQQVVTVSQTGNPLHFPSMYQDLSNGRETEVDYINGYIYDLGKKYNYEASTHNFLRDLVHLTEFTDKFDVNGFINQVLEDDKASEQKAAAVSQ